MQVDWEVEIGPDAPVIDAQWPGFIDLRLHPERARTLEETGCFPPLASALELLNRSASPIWTSKCDVWEPIEIDVDELDAPHEPGLKALACYIDLLPQAMDLWAGVEEAVRWCELCCVRLKNVPLASSRVDLIVRRAENGGRENALGVTAYLVACAPQAQEAARRLDRTLGSFADIVATSASARPADRGND